MALICERDKQWSFVGNKTRQYWLWSAYNTIRGGVRAYTFGPQTDETCRELLELLFPSNIGRITSDDWSRYAREVPKEKHLTGKIIPQRIERNNLALRTRIKHLVLNIISFSRSIKLHEKVTGLSSKNTCSTNLSYYEQMHIKNILNGSICLGKNQKYMFFSRSTIDIINFFQ